MRGLRWVVGAIAVLMTAGGACGIKADNAPPCRGCAAAECPAGATSCGGVCVTPESDVLNCGACGRRCEEGEACIAGGCVPACGDKARCGASCVDLAFDPDHCGTCDRACEAGQFCFEGRCEGVCEGGTTCGDACVNLENDREHCGACDAPCAENELCSLGACRSDCGPGVTRCGSRCVDTQLDPEHCGECDAACDVGLVCTGGECALACGGGMTRCASRCVDTELDRNHCGECDRACGANQVCSGGACASSCGGGTTRCDNRCVDTAWDPSHCGGCGVECEEEEVCSDGDCRSTCGAGTTRCRARCVDTAVDPGNCGLCDAPCAAGATCVQGECVESGDCSLNVELCNGIDDDCDQSTDEPFEQLDEACSVGTGACERTGTYVCGSDGYGVRCSAVAGMPAPDEDCNDVDDDCDGLVDYSVDAEGRPVSACRCLQEPTSVESYSKTCASGRCTALDCAITDAGEAVDVDFVLPACVSPFPFAQCFFESISVNDFDADHGAEGLLEVTFEITTATSGAKLPGVSLYIGDFPRRKLYRLFSEAELDNGLPPGRHTRFLRPADAICPSDPGLPSPCRNGCPNGVWGTFGDECVFEYDDVTLNVTIESCRGPGPTSASIEGLRIRHLTGPSCVCLDATNCTDPSRPVCRKTPLLPDPRCASQAPCAGGCARE